MLLLVPLLGLTVDYVHVYKNLSVLILSMPSIDGYGPRAQLLMDLIIFFKEWSLRTVLVICFPTVQGDFLVRFFFLSCIFRHFLLLHPSFKLLPQLPVLQRK